MSLLECEGSRGDIIYSKKSDVWSWGVTVWEAFTLGVPYGDTVRDPSCVFEKVRKEGLRLARPGSCPKEVWEIVVKCWDLDPFMRPTFKEIVSELRGVLRKLEEKNALSFIQKHQAELNTFENW